MMDKRVLTAEEKKWMQSNFMDTPYFVVSARLGVSTSLLTKKILPEMGFRWQKRIKQFGEERWMEILSKQRRSYKKTLMTERMRIDAGLPQKTKLHIGREDLSRAGYRCRMRRWGYIEDKEHDIFYFPNERMRHLQAEGNALRYDLRIRPLDPTKPYTPAVKVQKAVKKHRWVSELSYHGKRHRFRSTNYVNVCTWLEGMRAKTGNRRGCIYEELTLRGRVWTWH